MGYKEIFGSTSRTAHKNLIIALFILFQEEKQKGKEQSEKS